VTQCTLNLDGGVGEIKFIVKYNEHCLHAMRPSLNYFDFLFPDIVAVHLLFSLCSLPNVGLLN